MFRLFLLLFFLTSATAAGADIVAVYRDNPWGSAMTVEVGSNGNVRAQWSEQIYYLVDGVGYSVVDKGPPAPPLVMRADDAVLAIRDFLVLHGAKDDQLPPRSPPTGPKIVAREQVTVNGRTGTAYYSEDDYGRLSSEPVAVISHDPTLRPLGEAIARQYEDYRVFVGGLNGVSPLLNMIQILRSGTPIMLRGAKLQSVQFRPIAKAEFVLPGKPISRAEIVKIIERGH